MAIRTIQGNRKSELLSDLRVPSIGYYLHEWMCQDGFHGAPSLVIELLSPGTAHYDLHEKKFVYERQGVQEYWIVDPDTNEVEGYYLENAKYGEAVRLNGTITSRLLGQDFDF